VLEVIGVPVFMHRVDDRILKKLEADQTIRAKLLEVELACCTEMSLVNFAGHLQMVGQKPQNSTTLVSDAFERSRVGSQMFSQCF
jgi:hypothetical protein